MHRTLVVALALAAAACQNTQDIDDPGIQNTSVAIGTGSSELAGLAPETEQSQVEAQVQSLGGSFQSLVSQHQAYASVNAAPGVDAGGLAQSSSEFSFTEDGLQMSLVAEYSGLSYTYDVDLAFTRSGDATTMSGTYDLSYDLDTLGISYTYDVSVRYQDVVSEAGCLTGGSIEVDYRFDLAVAGLPIPGAAASNGSGTVIMTYGGCDSVTVSGTN